MNNLIDRWYPAPGGWFSNGPLSITESLSCSNYSMEWRSVIIGLALVCSKTSPFGWNHDLTTKKWQLKFSKTVKYVGITYITYITYITLHYITLRTIPYHTIPYHTSHFPNFEFVPHLILVAALEPIGKFRTRIHRRARPTGGWSEASRHEHDS